MNGYSAYYEVSVVLVEPDEPPVGAGRVLLFGIQTFLTGQPRLETSRSLITFTVPGEGTPRTIEVQPAQAGPGDPLSLLGVGLIGDRTSLLVRGATWDAPIEVDATWGVSTAGDRVHATVRASSGGQVLLPGTYAATVRVTRLLQRPDGGFREVEQLSNQTPFLITPGITAISALAPATGVFTVTGSTFQHADLLASAVKVFLGDTQLLPGTPGALTPGQMAIQDAANIQMRLPAGLTAGRWVPVRILVNGSESPPRWVQVP